MAPRVLYIPPAHIENKPFFLLFIRCILFSLRRLLSDSEHAHYLQAMPTLTFRAASSLRIKSRENRLRCLDLTSENLKHCSKQEQKGVGILGVRLAPSAPIPSCQGIMSLCSSDILSSSQHFLSRLFFTFLILIGSSPTTLKCMCAHNIKGRRKEIREKGEEGQSISLFSMESKLRPEKRHLCPAQHAFLPMGWGERKEEGQSDGLYLLSCL